MVGARVAAGRSCGAGEVMVASRRGAVVETGRKGTVDMKESKVCKIINSSLFFQTLKI